MCPRLWWENCGDPSEGTGYECVYSFPCSPGEQLKMLMWAHGELIKAWNTSNLSFVCVCEKQAFTTLCCSLLQASISEEQMCPRLPPSLLHLYGTLAVLISYLWTGPLPLYLLTNHSFDLLIINKEGMNEWRFSLILLELRLSSIDDLHMKYVFCSFLKSFAGCSLQMDCFMVKHLRQPLHIKGFL